MKYIRLFENFEEERKFDILDLYLMDLKEVEELFFKELRRTPPDLENIKVFLDSGLVDVHTKDGDGWTPLHWASWNNSLAVAELLISSGAEVEAESNNGSTPLDKAAYWNHLEIAKLLISSGADVNARAYDGSTPLDWAAIRGHQKMMKLLKKHGGVQ